MDLQEVEKKFLSLFLPQQDVCLKDIHAHLFPKFEFYHSIPSLAELYEAEVQRGTTKWNH